MRKEVLLALLFVPVAIATFLLTANYLKISPSSAWTASADAALAATSSDAVSSTTPATPSLFDVLSQLQEQEVFLTKELVRIEANLGTLQSASDLPRLLKRGDSGPDVRILQEMLIKNGSIGTSTTADASSTVTGYFGRATEQSLLAYQKQAGLEPSGVLDAATRNALVAQSGDATAIGSDFSPIDLSTVSGLDATGPIQSLQEQVTQLAGDDSATQSSMLDLQNQLAQMSDQLSSLQSSLAATQASIGSAAAAPATNAPAITGLAASNVTNNAATITWLTNVPTTSQVDYSANSSLPATTQTKSQTNAALVTSHSISLTGLAGNTTYFYRATSKDSGGTTVTSTILSFTTAH